MLLLIQFEKFKMKDSRQYLEESLELLVNRVKQANPDFSREDVLWLASAQMRSILVYGQEYRAVAEVLIASAKENAAK